MPSFNISVVVLVLMIEVGIEDFGFKDLIRPEGPRLRIILSAIINFAKVS